MVNADWDPLLQEEFNKPYWSTLVDFVTAERTAHEVYPPHDDVFAALHATSYQSIRAVILGQDPYHGLGQAHGLSFSVRPGVPMPPSLRNVFREREDDLGVASPTHGHLGRWAASGVLLLNTALTVRAHTPASHRGRGWEQLTDRIIAEVSAKPERVVFIFWGAHARSKRHLVNTARHTIIESAHPSPLSASRGFFGSKPFSRANHALTQAGLEPVDWTI